MKKNNNGYTYDAINNALTITADFAKKASVINSPEYRIIRQFRMENMGISIQKKSINAERSHTGIKYSDMERYMGLCRNADKYIKTYQTIRTLSKGQPSPYKYVRNWFDKQFPHYSEQPIIDNEGFVVENPDDVLNAKPFDSSINSEMISLPNAA